MSSIPVDKTTIADIHYLHKNFQYAILEDIEITWMTIGGNTEYVEGNDRIIAEIKISDNDELIFDTKINFAKKAFDAIEDVLERNGM